MDKATVEDGLLQQAILPAEVEATTPAEEGLREEENNQERMLPILFKHF
jgi:hypothetical protein